MSHTNPSHDWSNEYPSDHYKPVAKSKALKKKTKAGTKPVSKIAKKYYDSFKKETYD